MFAEMACNLATDGRIYRFKNINIMYNYKYNYVYMYNYVYIYKNNVWLRAVGFTAGEFANYILQ